MMTFDAEQFRSYALYRRRYIPDECVHLKKDCIWYVSDDPDGSLHLLDADEYADALTEGLITKEEAAAAMHALQRLMNAIEDGSFKELAAPIEQLQQIL